MVEGFSFAFLVALLWAGVAASYRRVTDRGFELTPFIAVATSVSALVSLAMVRWDAILGGRVERFWPLLLLMGIRGVCAQTGMLLVARAMATGAGAVSWTFVQSAMMAPFVFSVAYWGERPRPWQWLGLAAAMVGLYLLAASRARSTALAPDRQRAWLLLTVSGFASFAVAQTLSLAPSHWPGWEDVARLRVPIYFGSAATFFWCVTAWRRQRPRVAHFRIVVPLVGCVVGGQYALFASIDRLTVVKLAGLVQAIAVAGSVLAFAAYSQCWRRERASGRDWLGIGVCAIGLALIAFAPQS